MPEVDVIDKNSKPVGKINLPDDVFGVAAKAGVVHNAIVNFLANQRQGTHATKTKGLVSGGGKKPWKQKHTGRARAGSSRSPLWRGGGTVFGPQPRDYSYELPKKAKKLALKAVLSAKQNDGEIAVIDALALEKPRTKDMVTILEGLNLAGEKTLIVIHQDDRTVMLSARNIPGVTVKKVSDLNSYDVATHRKIVMTRQAVEKLSEARNK